MCFGVFLVWVGIFCNKKWKIGSEEVNLFSKYYHTSVKWKKNWKCDGQGNFKEFLNLCVQYSTVCICILMIAWTSRPYAFRWQLVCCNQINLVYRSISSGLENEFYFNSVFLSYGEIIFLSQWSAFLVKMM